jgi:membrane associated rhomboid family serine protease/predicted negative regulator of RcsB-dependent stress response
VADCRNCGKKLPFLTFGDDAHLCRACRNERARQRQRFGATNRSDFLTDTLGPNKATWALLAVNVIVFVAMVQAGVSVTKPEVGQLIAKGANFGPKTIGEGEYWRLITAGFVHIGITHIAINLICLWGLAKQLEQHFGAVTTIGVYVLTAAGAELLSMSYDPYRVSAGASGPIFGITGALLAFLYYGKHDLTGDERRAELRSIIQFAVINLLFGLAPGVDNMAHLGGLVTGLLIGVALSRRSREDLARIPVGVLGSAALIIALLVVPVARAKRPRMEIYAAQAAYQLRDWPEAIRLLRNRIDHAPKDAGAHAYLGDALQFNKQFDEAIAEYKIALQLEPSDDFVRMNLTSLQIFKQDYAGAKETLAPLLDAQDPGAEVYFYQGQILAGLKDDRGAIAAFSKSLAKQDSAEAHSALAGVYRAQGSLKDAQREEQLAAHAKERDEQEVRSQPGNTKR